MATQSFEFDVFRDAMDDAAAVAKLAKDERFFRDAYEAFRAHDAKAWRTALKRAGLELDCHLVCRWIRSKECFFLCLDLAGIPRPVDRAPDPRLLAESIVRLTADEAAVKRLVVAVEKRDQASFLKLADEFKFAPHHHFFCHWVCVIRYRLICRWICEPLTPKPPDLGLELRAAGQALGRLLAQKGGAFDAAVAASNANDADKMAEIFRQPGLLQFCHFCCEWFCSWRCTLACLTLCRNWPAELVVDQLKEAREFALVTQRLAQQPDDLSLLAAAVGSGDVKSYVAVVERLKLQRFALQLCHWICGLRCRRFCILVCPPIDTIPLFTHVGGYRVDPMWGDFQADGTTTAGRYAFTRAIPLRGIMPDGTAVHAYEYRFRYAEYTSLGPPVLGVVKDVDTSMIPATNIGQLEFWYWNAGLSAWLVASADYYVNNPGATVAIQQQFGPPLVVPVNKNVEPGGWIEVPRENQLFAGGVGRFVPNGNLATLDTRKLTSESFDLRIPAPGLFAGDAVPAAKKAAKPVFKIFYEARKVVGLAMVSGNDRDRIALCNVAYTYTRHLVWAGGDVTTKAVCSLDIAELNAPGATGCSRLNNHLHAMFTAYHPYLQGVSLWIEGNGVVPPLPTAGAPFNPLLPGADETTSPAGGHDFNITVLKPCAYILWMNTTVGLTEGWGLIGDATEHDHIAFCSR